MIKSAHEKRQLGLCWRSGGRYTDGDRSITSQCCLNFHHSAHNDAAGVGIGTLPLPLQGTGRGTTLGFSRCSVGAVDLQQAPGHERRRAGWRTLGLVSPIG
jgi:hypothetical protein